MTVAEMYPNVKLYKTAYMASRGVFVRVRFSRMTLGDKINRPVPLFTVINDDGSESGNYPIDCFDRFTF